MWRILAILIQVTVTLAAQDYWKLLEKTLTKLTDASGFIFNTVDTNSDDLKEIVRLTLYNTVGGVLVSAIIFAILAVVFKRMNRLKARVTRLSQDL